jgi:hypothetical protein
VPRGGLSILSDVRGRRSRWSASSAAVAGVRSSSLLPAQVGAAGPSPQSVTLCAT